MPRRLPELDLLEDCVRSVCEQTGERIPHSHVTQTCCPFCHNPKCKRAGWADSKWQQRMNTQEEYLLINPKFSDLTLPSHMEVHQVDWVDTRRKAMKLHIAAQKGDWTPVTDAEVDGGSTDGRIEMGSEEGANAVDKALAALRKKQGKPKPNPPKLAPGIEDPTVNGTPPPYEPKRPPPKKQPTPEQARKLQEMANRMAVSVEEDPKPAPEQPAPEQPAAETEPAPPKPQSPKRPPPPAFLGNTPVPKGGIMVDGTPAERAPEADPWAPRKKDKFIKPHAKVQMGKGKDDGED